MKRNWNVISSPCVEDYYKIKRLLDDLRISIYARLPSMKKVFAAKKFMSARNVEELNSLQLSVHELDDILCNVNFISNNIVTRLEKQYDLSFNDLVICALTLLKMTNKEILILTGMNQEYIKKNKWRMKTKIFKLEKGVTVADFLLRYQDCE